MRLTTLASLRILRNNQFPRDICHGANLQPPPTNDGQGLKIGHYTVLDKIGTGGMGEVFSAVRSDGQFDQKVAIKLVRSVAASGLVLDHFRNERQILAGLDHPNIARLLDGGSTEDGTPYIVMELVAGRPIDEYCDVLKLSVSRRIELFLQVCAAVQYAHQHLIVHRDIKPGNILVSEDGTPKLLDFGIARIFDASGVVAATQYRSFTPDYASPEQLRGEPLSTATDLYSLGVVLYRLLTGRSPYRVDPRAPGKLATAITKDEPERPSTCVTRSETLKTGDGLQEMTPEFFSEARETTPVLLQKRLRGDLDYILLKALRKEPELRYSSAEQFSEDLRRHLEKRPVLARKGTWNYRAGKFIRRNRAAVIAAGLVAATLLAGIAVTWREIRLAESNRRKADARFNDVRKLANSLIFDVHDSIENLPGAGGPRKLILQKANQYLDSLAAETQNDPVFMRDLVVGYSRIAELEGNPAHPNLGDTKGALANYQKALEMAQVLARVNPKSELDQLNLAELYLSLGEVHSAATGNIPEATRNLELSLPIFDRAVQSNPKSFRAVTQSTRAYFTLGSLRAGGGLGGTSSTVESGVDALEKALSLDRRALELSPKDISLRAELAGINAALGDAYLKLANRIPAEQRFREALETISALDPKGENIRIAINKSVLTAKVGDALMLQGKYPEALAYYQAGVEIAVKVGAKDQSPPVLVQMVTSHAQSALALRALGRFEESNREFGASQAAAAQIPPGIALFRVVRSVVGLWFAQSLMHQGKTREALQEFERSKALIASLGDVRALDPRTKTYFCAVQFGLGSALVAEGKFPEAQKEIDPATSMLEQLADAAPPQQELLYTLAEAYNQKGVLFDAQAKKASKNPDRVDDWKNAKIWFEKSAAVWNKVKNPSRFSTYGLEVSTPTEVSRRIAECDSQLNSVAQPAN